MIDASDAAEDMENAEATDAIEPIESADPTEPIDSTEPREPIDSSELSDQSDHFESDTERQLAIRVRSIETRSNQAIDDRRESRSMNPKIVPSRQASGAGATPITLPVITHGRIAGRPLTSSARLILSVRTPVSECSRQLGAR
jgi:hypothetical protein